MTEYKEMFKTVVLIGFAIYPVGFLIEFTTSVWRTNKASHAAKKPLGLQPRNVQLQAYGICFLMAAIWPVTFLADVTSAVYRKTNKKS